MLVYVRDYAYAQGRRFDLGRINPDIFNEDDLDFRPGDSILHLSIYTAVPCSYYRDCDSADFWVDPNDTSVDTTEFRFTKVRQLQMDEFVYHPTKFWVLFERTNAGTNGEIGAYVIVKRANDQIDTIGNVSGDPYQLKLIRHRTPVNSFTTWHYEWRNIYFLPSRYLDTGSVEIRVFKGPAGTEGMEQNLDSQSEYPFTLLMGLMKTDTLYADHEWEINPVNIDYERGLLIFPSRRPFDTDDTYWGGIILDEKVPEIYDSNNRQDAIQESDYYIEIKLFR